MNESIPSMLQPPQAAQKLRTWFRVRRGLTRAESCTAIFSCVSTRVPREIGGEDIVR